MNQNEYKCAMCENIYEKGWTDEESMSECTETFGDVSMDDCDVICDDCYNKINPADNPQLVKETIAEIKKRIMPKT